MKIKKITLYILAFIAVLFGVYFILDTENKQLDKTERKKLGGTYIQLSDGITHYKLSGESKEKLIVLVHGGTIPSWTWDKQIKDLTDSGYKVLVYDKYGRGYSDRPKIKYNQELYKRQLLELVNKLGFKEFDLMGLSVGGGTVVNFTAQYPSKVRKLILISPLIKDFKLPKTFQIPVIGEFIARLIGIKTIVKRFALLTGNDPEAETRV